MYWFGWFKSLEEGQLYGKGTVFPTPYFFREFVTNVRTSWFSSSSNMVPR